jgi:hypothetical protein
MGEIVAFVKPPAPDAAPKPKRRREPRGFLLVPLRILDAAKVVENSLSACVYDGKSTGTIAWRELYMILAALDDSAKYL